MIVSSLVDLLVYLVVDKFSHSKSVGPHSWLRSTVGGLLRFLLDLFVFRILEDLEFLHSFQELLILKQFKLALIILKLSLLRLFHGKRFRFQS